MLGYGQTQKQAQKLSPQQIQYLKLLQLPVTQLEERIKQELALNPFLEEGMEMEVEDVMEMELNQDIEIAVKQQLDAEYEEVTGEAIPNKEDEYTLEDFMKGAFDDDIAPSSSNNYSDSDEGELPWQPPAVEPLVDKLLHQLAPIANERELKIAGEILGNIDEDGYLKRDIEDIVDDLNLGEALDVTREEVEEVLKKIQHLDPPGIGARDLRECLRAQIEVMDLDDERKKLALRIIDEAYDDFMAKRYQEILRNLNITEDELKQAIRIIQHLNPKPGEGRGELQEYIVPDFIVEKIGDELVVQLNERGLPSIKLNRNYYELAKREKNLNPEIREVIRKQFERAKWFIASIYQRRDTLLKVMNAIVDLQREFFETGEKLKPMIYKDVAKKAGVDISTVSRVVNEKYVQTDYGIYKLRDFFTDRIDTRSGEGVSNMEVKERIREIISREDPENPYTDDKIAEILRAQGYNIARRTVTKYREQLGIPVARLRRGIK